MPPLRLLPGLLGIVPVAFVSFAPAAPAPASAFTIERSTILTGRNHSFYTQSRAAVVPGTPTRVIVTTQETDPRGAHGYKEMFMVETTDLGATWSQPEPIVPLRRRRMPEGHDFVIGDVCPQWHAATGRVLATGGPTFVQGANTGVGVLTMNGSGENIDIVTETKHYTLKLRHRGVVEDLAATHQNTVNESREFEETVSAGYFRVDTRLLQNRLWIVAGARYERTDTEGRGPLNDINAQFQRNANGTLVDGNPNQAGIQRVPLSADPLVLRQLRFVDRGASSKRNYDGWYPSLNASYDLSEQLVLRAAFARTLGRPNGNLIIPGTTITEPDVASPRITINNTGLQPWTANNYDLSLESYHIKGGFGSVGIFRKDIKNFFGQIVTPATPELLEQVGLDSDPSLLSYEVATRTNIGDARIDGFEVGYRQNLTFLPQWARGFQVFFNFTKLDLTGANTADFTGYNKESMAGGINFVRPRFFIKVTVSHLGDLRRGAVAANAANGIPAETFNYQAKRTHYSANLQYSLTKRTSLYASATDIGGFVQNLQRYAPNTPEYAKKQRWQELGFYTNIGVRATF